MSQILGYYDIYLFVNILSLYHKEPLVFCRIRIAFLFEPRKREMDSRKHANSEAPGHLPIPSGVVVGRWC